MTPSTRCLRFTSCLSKRLARRLVGPLALRPGHLWPASLPTVEPFLTATFMADQSVAVDSIERDGKLYQAIKEGKATILAPLAAKANKNGGEEQQVFYNPIQQYNRDLSVLAIKAYGKWALERRCQNHEDKCASRQSKQGKKRKREAEKPASALTQPSDTEQEAVARGSESARQIASEPTLDRPVQDSAAKLSFKILDALSASGLRALRYAHELPFVTSVKANDLSERAAASIRLNVEFNGLQDLITVTNDDALALMYRVIADGLSTKYRRGNPSRLHKFDVIDLDPYGSAAPFFDAAIQSVRDDGGLLCITCTDSAVWAGHSYCEKTFALYGGIPIKGPFTHEAALRIILYAVATAGSKYSLSIEPLLSLSIDFYTKLFIRVTRSPQAVKFLGAKTMLVYNCDQGCGAWETQSLLRSRPTPNKKGDGSFFKHSMALGPTADRYCQHCGFKMHVSGPMHAGHIHSQEFIQRILNEIPGASSQVYGTLARLEGMLRTAQEEYIPGPEPSSDADPKEVELATVDHYPFFVVSGKISSIVSCATPNDDMFRGALIHLGYQVGRSHCRPGSIKTNAPWTTIWWVMTEWIRQKSPIKASKFKPTMAAWKILRDARLLGQSSDDDAEGAKQQDENIKTGDEEGIESQRKKKPHQLEGDNKLDDIKTEPSSEGELRKTLVFNDSLARLGRQRASQRYVRYQMNPHSYWGPMTRARGS